jgi:hypothetical protein
MLSVLDELIPLATPSREKVIKRRK